MTITALVYCRISRDDEGEGLGVKRQEADCRALCERRGWLVVDVLTDNDYSAYSGRTRPGYERLVSMVSEGSIGAVVAWSPERLHRSPRQLEDFIELVERSGTIVETVKAGTWDVSSSHGRLVARMLGAVSRAESERIGERVSRAHRQAKRDGRWRGPIPYGMRPTTVPGMPEPDPDTAPLVEAMAASVLRGDALTRIAADLNARGIRPRRGKAWTHTSVSRLLASPALGGLLQVDGELRPAAFSGPLSTGDWRAVQAEITGRPRGVSRRPRETLTLLGGTLTCAEHEVPLFGAGSRHASIYQAHSPGTCHVRIPREPTDSFVRDLVIERLRRDDARAVLLRSSDAPADAVAVETLRQRRGEIAGLVADGLLTPGDARDQLQLLAARIADLEAGQTSGPITDRSLVDPVAAWEAWTTPQRREVVSLLLASITVRHASAANGPRADLTRLSFRWRM